MSAPSTPRRAWRVEVTQECVGSGMCIATSPEYFDLVGGFSRPRVAYVVPDDAVIAAAELCPMGAIRVTDASTGMVRTADSEAGPVDVRTV